MGKSNKYTFQRILKTPVWQQNNQSTISYKIITVITEFCCKYLPKPVRKHTLSAIYVSTMLVSRISMLINQLNFSTYIVSGKEKHSGTELRIIYITSEGLDPYISNVLFCDIPQCEKIGKISIWNIKKECSKFSSTIDAIFIKSDMFYSRFFKNRGFIIFPELISMTLDLTKPFEKILDNFSVNAKREIRKAKKYGYPYEISQDLEKLKLFYHKMYLPYAYQKHGKLAICVNFNTIRHLFETGYKLMLIKQNEEIVSGWLFSLKKKTYTARYMGITKGKTGLLRQGLGAAAFYFSILWAKENGVKIINFGACRPFLNDGVFRYKRKWGTKVEVAEKLFFYNNFALKICSDSKAIHSFLLKNPFICINDSQLQEMTFEQNSH